MFAALFATALTVLAFFSPALALLLEHGTETARVGTYRVTCTWRATRVEPLDASEELAPASPDPSPSIPSISRLPLRRCEHSFAQCLFTNLGGPPHAPTFEAVCTSCDARAHGTSKKSAHTALQALHGQ